MTDDLWDGTERRAVSPQALAQQVGEIINDCLQTKNGGGRTGTQPNQVPWMIYSAFLLGLVVIGVFMVARISGKASTVLDETRNFRASITCFFVQSAEIPEPPPAGAYATLLDDCGFIDRPGRGR